jgi:hypothetical protein
MAVRSIRRQWVVTAVLRVGSGSRAGVAGEDDAEESGLAGVGVGNLVIGEEVGGGLERGVQQRSRGGVLVAFLLGVEREVEGRRSRCRVR